VSIILISHWFGAPWPPWVDFFFISAAANSKVQFLVLTDQKRPASGSSDNLTFREISFDDYKRQISKQLKVDLSRIDPYKLCDIKPAIGFLHEEDSRGYSHYGYHDIDVIFGDLGPFLSLATEKDVDIVSAHGDRLAGHLCVFRNRRVVRESFRRIPRWRKQFADPKYRVLDEYAYERAVGKRRWQTWHRSPLSIIFSEQYATVDAGMPWLDGKTSSPQHWIWRDGRLTNDENGLVEFTYLHFMNWKENRWRKVERFGTAPWPLLDDIVKVDWRDAAREGFTISPNGIESPRDTLSGIRN
jgi:hypothetical protein